MDNSTCWSRPVLVVLPFGEQGIVPVSSHLSDNKVRPPQFHLSSLVYKKKLEFLAQRLPHVFPPSATIRSSHKAARLGSPCCSHSRARSVKHSLASAAIWDSAGCWGKPPVSAGKNGALPFLVAAHLYSRIAPFLNPRGFGPSVPTADIGFGPSKPSTTTPGAERSSRLTFSLVKCDAKYGGALVLKHETKLHYTSIDPRAPGQTCPCTVTGTSNSTPNCMPPSTIHQNSPATSPGPPTQILRQHPNPSGMP